jgi:hypothetical protein
VHSLEVLISVLYFRASPPGFKEPPVAFRLSMSTFVCFLSYLLAASPRGADALVGSEDGGGVCSSSVTVDGGARPTEPSMG